MPEHLEQGRKAYRLRAWEEAHRALARADEAEPLGIDDLELLAVASYLVGRDDDFLHTLERAHHLCRDADEEVRAARCAFWIGLRLLLRGESGPASGWLGRAKRLLDRRQAECAERGYLALPAAERCLAAGDPAEAHRLASDALDIGRRFADADLTAAAQHLLGRALVRQGEVERGLTMLDEAMVAVTAGELSPIMTGLIYCSVIEACRQVLDLERARDWTSALARWCDEQRGMVAFTATCRVHRAEILELEGAWDEAAAEARRAHERRARSGQAGLAAAFYRQAELHRLRGEFAAAEEAYRRASRAGRDPQPGLALLRLAQGRTETAVAAIRRLEGTTTGQLERIDLLPACVEILLAAGDTDEARRAADELEAVAGEWPTQALQAMAAEARGAVELAEGAAQAAVAILRRARDLWGRLEAPHRVARVRTLVARACRQLGDADGAALELEAARATFVELGATPDLERIDALAGATSRDRVHGLSPRELQVLREVAAGKTNKAIAEALGISDKTVARHISNIFDKLGLSSRTGATAYAYEHGLLQAGGSEPR